MKDPMKTKTKKKTGAAARPAMKKRNATQSAPAVATQPAADPAPARAQGNGKAVFSIRVSPALLEKARNACFFTPGLTLAALTETALTATLARMEAERGKTFPARTAELPSGRPIV